EAIAVEPQARIKRAELAPGSAAKACEVTAVVCDMANKYDLVEECEPAVFAEITERFLAQTTEAFRKAGAYIESAGGEGVVAIFGFPESDKQHAEKAARLAMVLTQASSDSNTSDKSDVQPSVGVHAGVSSGIMIMAPELTPACTPTLGCTSDLSDVLESEDACVNTIARRAAFSACCLSLSGKPKMATTPSPPADSM